MMRVSIFGVSRDLFRDQKITYCMYTQPAGEIIKRRTFKYNCRADDIQVCMTLNPHDKWDDILY